MTTETKTIIKKEEHYTKATSLKKVSQEGIEEARLKEELKAIKRLQGAAKRKTTEEEYERGREQAFEEISKLRGSAKRKITDEEYEQMRREGIKRLAKERGWTI